MLGKIVKVTKNSVYINTMKNWKKYKVQISIRKKDLKEVFEYLGEPIEYEISDRGYLVIKGRTEKIGV